MCVLTCQEAPPILLYTGHAAKGLEFDVVHIANYSLLPSKRALEAGGLKLEQEYKVMFVMLTRVRHTLAFLAEPEGGPRAPHTCVAAPGLPGLGGGLGFLGY